MLRSMNRVTPGFDQLYREVDNVVQHLFGGEENVATGFSPRTNVAETDTAFEVSLELPGIVADDVQLEVQDGCLTVSGERQNETELEGKRYHRVERRYGKFRRVVRMPENVDEERIEASYKDGILWIVLPKCVKETTRKITIKTS